MATIESDQCYICKKLFCCVDCCSNHIKNKHYTSECTCPLCRGEPLIIREFHHQSFLSHIVTNHLPLCCRKCGRLFSNHDDLINLNTCKQCPLINIEPPTSTTIETSTSDLSLVPKISSDIQVLKKSFSWTDSYSNSIKNSPPTSTRHTSTPMHIGFLKQKFSALIKSPNILLKTPQNLIKSPSIDDKQKKLTDKQNSNRNKEESVYFDFTVAKSSLDWTPLKSILSSKSSSNDTSQENYFYSITEKKQQVMQDSHKSLTTNNDHSSSPENNISDQESSYSGKRRLKSGKDCKDTGKKVRFSDQFENMSIISEYEDVNSRTIDTTGGGDEFYEACQSFSEVSSMPVKNLPITDTKVKLDMIKKKSNDKKNNICNEIKEIKELTKENNCTSSSSKVVMMVLMENTGNVNIKELPPIINSSLKKLESIVSQSSRDHLQAQQNKENNGLTIVSVDSYTRLSSVECYEASEPINRSQKGQQAVKHSSGIFATVANVVKNALKNLSGVVITKNSLTNSINSSSTSLLQPPIQHSTLIMQNDSSNIQGSRACKRPREENVLVDKFDIENSNQLNIVQSPLQKKARRWYKSIRGRQPIDRMKDQSYPRGISREIQRFQQGAYTVKDTILPLPARAFQVDRSTQTDF